MKTLMLPTSHYQLGDTGRKTDCSQLGRLLSRCHHEQSR